MRNIAFLFSFFLFVLPQYSQLNGSTEGLPRENFQSQLTSISTVDTHFPAKGIKSETTGTASRILEREKFKKMISASNHGRSLQADKGMISWVDDRLNGTPVNEHFLYLELLRLRV